MKDAPDWTGLVIAAGLDPSDVSVTVKRRRLLSRRPPAVGAMYLPDASEVVSWGEQTLEANAERALRGLVDLLSPDAGG